MLFSPPIVRWIPFIRVGRRVGGAASGTDRFNWLVCPSLRKVKTTTARKKNIASNDVGKSEEDKMSCYVLTVKHLLESTLTGEKENHYSAQSLNDSFVARGNNATSALQ